MIGISKNLVKTVDEFENSGLILSISKTRFVLHSIYGDNLYFVILRTLIYYLQRQHQEQNQNCLSASTRF